VPLFGRNRRALADPRALSANVQEQDECWRVTWLGDGENKLPEYEAASLTEVTDLATAGALAAYRTGHRPPGAVLTFVIFPRGYGTRELLYEISGTPGRLKARFIEDDTRQVEAPDLDQLIKAARQQAHTDYAFFSWVRPLADSPAQ
jgi:hypothetical protein